MKGAAESSMWLFYRHTDLHRSCNQRISQSQRDPHWSSNATPASAGHHTNVVPHPLLGPYTMVHSQSPSAVHLQLLQKEHWGGERQYSCTYLTVTLEEHHWCSQYRLYFIHLLSPLLNYITEVAKLTHFLGSRRQPGNPWDVMAFPERNSNQKSQFNSWSITRTNSKQMPYRKWQLAMSANCLGSKSLKHRVRKMNQACNCPIISLCWWHVTTYFLKTSKLVTNKWQQIHFWFISFNNSWFISQSSLTYAEFLSKILLLTQ